MDLVNSSKERARKMADWAFSASARLTLRSSDGRLRWRLSRQESPLLMSTRSWFEANQMIGGFLPLELVEGERVHAWIALRDSNVPLLYRRWLVLSEPCFAEGSPVTQGEALAALLDLARANRVNSVRCASIFADWTAPELDKLRDVKVRSENVGTFLLDLTAPEDEWVARMHQKHRYALRRGQRDGLEVHEGVRARTFVELMETTYQRGGRSNPFSSEYLTQLIEDPPVSTCVASVTQEGAVHAAVITVHDTRRAWYVHGVSVDRPATGATVLCHLGVMQRLRDRGVEIYDLGGAVEETDDPRIAGITRFKSRFGAPFRPRQRFTLDRVGRDRRLAKMLGLAYWK